MGRCRESVWEGRATKVKKDRLAIKALRNGKASCMERLLDEVLKIPGVDQWLSNLLNLAWEVGTQPPKWETAELVNKGKGDARVTENNRRIALLLPSLEKNVLESRRRMACFVSMNQYGFQQGRSTQKGLR